MRNTVVIILAILMLFFGILSQIYIEKTSDDLFALAEEIYNHLDSDSNSEVAIKSFIDKYKQERTMLNLIHDSAIFDEIDILLGELEVNVNAENKEEALICALEIMHSLKTFGEYNRFTLANYL